MDTIEHFNGGTMCSGKDAVEVFRLASLISALKLQQKGIKLSRRVSALAIAKVTTGLKTRKIDVQIARLEIMLENQKRLVTYLKNPERESLGAFHKPQAG